ncbi:MAG: ABC transporter ATP-binding protein [Clostridiales bacterium]|nr:ABC transporter ATP-binding protein [Clostridiales bacterium]
MNEYILQTHNISKEYNGVKTLDDVSVSIRAGRLYGFIGQNGAGKTTLFRIIAGLSCPTSGRLSLFGASGGKELAAARRRMGSLIETPALYPDMTAYENLEIHQVRAKTKDRRAINETLELVSLTDTGKKRAKDFSLGMKQRLAIGAALVGDPEFLLLDEPINGLDPLGIAEMREALRRLCSERKMTILISSHLLPELYQLASNYIFIDRGRILEETTLSRLCEKCARHISITVNDTALAASVLERDLGASNFKAAPDGTIELFDFVDRPEAVSKALVERGVALSRISAESESLESYFINLIGGGERG